MIYLDEKNNPKFLEQFSDFYVSDVDLFLDENVNIIDVRAYIEYENSYVLNSFNLPILEDDERKKVGICYKNEGKEKAVNLGYKILDKEKIKIFVEKIDEIINSSDKKTFIMCSRGGLRSKISQGLYYVYKYGDIDNENYFNDLKLDLTPINEEKLDKIVNQNNYKQINLLRLKDGYKSLRNRCIEEITKNIYDIKSYTIGGHTGSGKTKIIEYFDNSIDLEFLAKHRGSAFGEYIEKQPSQANFENNLAYEVFNKSKKYPFLIFEKEGANIGKINLPKEFLEYINNNEIILIESSLEERIENIYNTYVIDFIKEYKIKYNENGYYLWRDFVYKSFEKVRKKLGNQNYNNFIEIFNESEYNLEKNKIWIEMIIKYYYDPLYEKKRNLWADKIVFTGNMEECKQFILNKLQKFN